MMSATCGKPSVRRTASAAPGPKRRAGRGCRRSARRAGSRRRPGPSTTRAVLLAADQQEADAGVVGEGAEQGGVAARRSPRGSSGAGTSGKEIRPRLPEASTTGSERPALGRCSLAAPPSTPAGAARRSASRAASRASAPLWVRSARRGHGQPAAGAHQVAEGQPVARPGRSRRGSGRGRTAARSGRRAGACSATLAISARDRSRRSRTCRGVAAVRPGVVGHLVVADQVGVDGGAPGEHVARSPRRPPRRARRRSRRPG